MVFLMNPYFFERAENPILTLQLPNRLVLNFITIGSFSLSSFEKMTNEIEMDKLIR